MASGIDFIGGNPGNYVLGRGKVYLQGESALQPKGWRDIGNCTAFTVNQESEKKEHQSFLTGVKTVDLEVAVSTKVNISFTLDEVANFLNLAMFFNGEAVGLPVLGNIINAANVDSESVADAAWGGVGPVHATTQNWQSLEVRRGMWYDLELKFSANVLAIVGGDIFRAYNFASNQVFEVRKNPTTRTANDGTLLVEGTDYELDRKEGRIRLISGIVWNDSTDLLRVGWSRPTDPAPGNPAGVDLYLDYVKILTKSSTPVAVKFVLENPNDSNKHTEFEFFKVNLNPEGDFAGIGDDWASMSFTGVASSIASPPVMASPYGRITGSRA